MVDDKTKLLEGRSLSELKEALKGKVQETLSAVADDGIEQSGLHIWSFEVSFRKATNKNAVTIRSKPGLRWWTNATARRSNCLIIRRNSSR